MAEGSSLEQHIKEFNMCDSLKTIDEGLNDKFKALLLVSSLPKSYEHSVDDVIYGMQTLTLDEVKVALNTRELQGKQDVMENGSSEVLTTKRRYDKKKKKRKGNKKSKKTS